MKSAAIRILLVDDHQIMRQGLRLLIASQPGLNVVGEAGDGRSAMELARTLAPDLVVMDVHLPGENGVAVSRQLLVELPAIKIIMLSSDPAPGIVQEALMAGAAGYITKERGNDELLRAISTVMDHRLYLSPEVASVIVTDYMRVLAGKPPPAAKPLLAGRERELLRLVAEGHRNKEIADELAITIKAVEAYRSRLMKKLGCCSTAELVRYAIREGITPA